MMLDLKPRGRTNYIAVHCSATKPSQNVDEDEIRQWHQDKGWVDIGYHIVIPRDGTIQIGRPLDYIGAHVEGFNSSSIGICLVGGLNEETNEPEKNFTDGQMNALIIALKFCRRYAPNARIQGHRDFPNVAKACPSFDVREWLAVAAPELL